MPCAKTQRRELCGSETAKLFPRQFTWCVHATSVWATSPGRRHSQSSNIRAQMALPLRVKGHRGGRRQGRTPRCGVAHGFPVRWYEGVPMLSSPLARRRISESPLSEAASQPANVYFLAPCLNTDVTMYSCSLEKESDIWLNYWLFIMVYDSVCRKYIF